MISIQRIKIGEGELFKNIRLQSLQESPYAFGSSYEAALERSPESWNEQADSTAQGSDRATFIAFEEGLPVGITALYRDQQKPDFGELLQVWVAPKYRGAGLAARILDTVIHWGKENGFRTILAGVTKDNERALRFYQKHGFEVTDIRATEDLGGFYLVKELQFE